MHTLISCVNDLVRCVVYDSKLTVGEMLLRVLSAPVNHKEFFNFCGCRKSFEISVYSPVFLTERHIYYLLSLKSCDYYGPTNQFC